MSPFLCWNRVCQKIDWNEPSTLAWGFLASWYSALSSGQRGRDDEVSSTSEDEGYPEDMDQDKHDESSDDSDSDRSDADSDGDEFLHRDNDKERDGGEEKKGV